MLCKVRLRNKKCSETEPVQRCSGPEQYQYPFRYYLYITRITVLPDTCMHLPNAENTLGESASMTQMDATTLCLYKKFTPFILVITFPTVNQFK